MKIFSAPNHVEELTTIFQTRFNQSQQISFISREIFNSLNQDDKLHNNSNSDLGVDAELLSTITQTQQENKHSA
jgi:hypothetical protein